MAKTWRIKDGAPPHYVHGQGLKQAGETFVGGDQPMSMHVVEVVAEAPAAPAPVVKAGKGGGKAKAQVEPEAPSPPAQVAEASTEPVDGF